MCEASASSKIFPCTRINRSTGNSSTLRERKVSKIKLYNHIGPNSHVKAILKIKCVYFSVFNELIFTVIKT